MYNDKSTSMLFDMAASIDRNRFELRSRVGMFGVVVSGLMLLATPGLLPEKAQKPAMLVEAFGIIACCVAGKHYSDKASETIKTYYVPTARGIELANTTRQRLENSYSRATI